MSSNPAIVIGVSAVNTADAELKKVDNKIRETTGVVQTEGNKMAAATDTISQRVKANFANIATAAAGLGAGIVGFATSFSTLEKAQTRSDQAQLTYEKSLSRLNEMIAKGTYSADELAQQQEKVRINQDKAKQSQDSLNDTYTNFLANIPSQLMAFGMSANSIYTMLKAQQTTTAATSTISAATYTGALASMNTANTATMTTTQMLGNVMRTVFLSNPITLPLVAIGTLFALIATNAFGLRDAINAVGKAIGDALPFLRPLLNVLGGLNDVFDGGSKKSKDLAQATNDIDEAADRASKSADGLATSYDQVGKASDGAKKSVQTLNEYLAQQSSKLADTAHDNLLYVQSTGAVKNALDLTNDRLSLTAEYLRKQQQESEHTKQENFNLVASYMGLEKTLGLTDAQVQQYANALKVAKATHDDLKTSIDATSSALDGEKTKIDTVKSALDALAEAQQRNVITQFGMQVGLGGSVSVDALNAAAKQYGFTPDADTIASAAGGRLGGVFVAGQGRVLDTGGQLYEDVIGVGKETGTPHLLHKNEFIVPPNKLSSMSRSAGTGNGNNANFGDLNITIVQDSNGNIKSVDARLGGKRIKFSGRRIISSNAR